MFSIIVSLNNIDSIRNLLMSPCKDAELIVIDGDYKEEKKDSLKDHQYKRIIYAPQKKRDGKYNYNYLNGCNTGLAYAEEQWCFVIGDNCELKPDFFDRLKETIALFTDLYKNRFVIRPTELETGNNDLRWVSYIRFKQRYFFLPCAPLGATGVRRNLPICTCGAIVIHRENWYTINGFDERYDIGHCWYDNDIFDRFHIMRFPIILDQKLMIFTQHKIFGHIGKEECKQIYDATLKMRLKGSVYSPNSFDLRMLHDELNKQKARYKI